MNVTRFGEAQAYSAPNHFDVRALRLQGFAPGGPEQFWVGLSHFLPGGGAGPDSSPLEKVYVVLAGAVTVKTPDREVVLGPLDSCTIAANEIREVKNNGNEVATMIVVMPYPEAKA
ncbi:cupin domain-containing protein [Pararobbsia silviterrae]|uniref:Cupin domain-containing protein n=1 Tax=Pararobbsia silviterrae TaxID=1792498 RepID=A0A494Y9Q9_9BURK|nr:cupin domain-containing protein [Pararobbsia silviterrae]RKP58420.1 cupin domain-containing protein [Pararobbsia silviterrae]